MPNWGEYRTTDKGAARRLLRQPVRRRAEAVRADAQGRTPRGKTGKLARGWKLEQGRDPASVFVVNNVPYARFVEYGTRRRRARPMLGPAAARARARST